LKQSEFKNRNIIPEIHRIGSLMVKPILIKFADTSDLSKVFVIDDIFTFWLAISEIIRVKTPIVSPWQFIVDCQMIFTQFSQCVLAAISKLWCKLKIMGWDG